jgi:hypothetical protein
MVGEKTMRRERFTFVVDFENLSPPRQAVYEAVIQSESFGVNEPPSGIEYAVISCVPIRTVLWFSDTCVITESGNNAKKWAPPLDDETILKNVLLV